MIGALGRLRARFRGQFTPSAGGYVYRRGSRGAALPVSAADAEAFVTRFDRATRWLGWGGVLASMTIFAALSVLGVDAAFWAVAGPFVLIWGALFWVAWDAPHRELNGRAPVAPALSGSEVRRHGLRTLPWRVLVLGVVLAIGLAARVAFEPDPLAPANLGYFAFAAVLLLAFGAMALAKLRAR